MRLEELRKELKGRNAKVSGRKHEILVDRCVLFYKNGFLPCDSVAAIR